MTFPKSKSKHLELNAMEIKSLQNIDFEVIFKAFSKAFAEYEMQVTKEEFRTMITRRGFVPELSFGAFDRDEIVSFTFNGIGMFNGKKTAYDTGTGTLEEFRGQGLASKIFAYSVPYLKEQGVEQYLLEVLQHNEKAVSVYKKVDFKVSREFNYFVEDSKNLKIQSKELPEDIMIKQTDLSQKTRMLEFCDFDLSWQNKFEAVERIPEDFKILGAFKGEQLVGHCIIDPTTGDITQIAVSKSYRRKGIGTNLLNEASKINNYDSMKVINTEIGHDAIKDFLKFHSMRIKGKQYEMIKQL